MRFFNITAVKQESHLTDSNRDRKCEDLYQFYSDFAVHFLQILSRFLFWWWWF